MDQDLNSALIVAAWRNDIDECARLIELGADVNAKDETVQSAYLISTSEGFHTLLSLTLAHGGDVDSKDSYNGTGLIRAAERGHAFLVGTLLRAGIAIDHINNVGWTALHESIILGDGGQRYADTVRVLLAAGADPTIPSQQDGVLPLDHALNRSYCTLADSIWKVLQTALPSDPGAALFEAANLDDGDGVMMALRAGADPGAQDESGNSALALAARQANQDVSRLLQAFTGPV